MADILLKKNHVIHSIKDQEGNRDINYFTNTTQDVLIDEEATEDIRGHITYYAKCNTAANVKAKTISVVDGNVDALKVGVQLNVTFPNGNSVAPITLAVNKSPDYNVEGVIATSIIPNQTLILIFTGNSFIIGGSSGVAITKEERIGKDPDQTRYLTFVDGETGNAKFKIDPAIKINKSGLVTEVGESTVNFTAENPSLITDIRSTHTPSPKDTLKVFAKKVRKLFDALGKLAFKDEVTTAELNTQLKDHYNLTVHKSGKINGADVNDLYNAADFTGTVGTKALDAAVGKTLQDQITSLNGKKEDAANNIWVDQELKAPEWIWGGYVGAPFKHYIFRPSSISVGYASSVDWTGVKNKPSTYAPSSHTHDDRYYTETEVDRLTVNISNLVGATKSVAGVTNIEYVTPNLSNNTNTWHSGIDTLRNAIRDSTNTISGAIVSLNGSKANTSHTHAWDNITGKPTSFSPSSHTHDDRYYTETEVDKAVSDAKKILEKAITDARKEIEDAFGQHNHDSRYYTENEIDQIIADAIKELDKKVTGKTDKKSDSPTYIWGTYTDVSQAYLFKPAKLKVEWNNILNNPMPEEKDSNGVSHLRIPNKYNLYLGTMDSNGDSNLYLGGNVFAGTVTDSYLTIGVCPASGNYPGLVRRTTMSSSRRYKENIHNLYEIDDPGLDPRQLYNLQIKTYRYKDGVIDNSCDICGKQIVGIIAEELDELMPTAVVRVEGKVERWREIVVVPAMLALIQEQHKEIEELKHRIEIIEKYMS